MMTKEKLKICNELYAIAKKQFETGVITRQEYLETLVLIRSKLDDLKKGFDKIEFPCKTFNKPILEINVKETVNFVLSMN
ncbi:hypothetical protein [Chryseobacterium sp. ZHDP1]|uniref:hypothetical protein n=1 Tax=Chryseobacterium sp. ZHDP1 TaxID=2838877 RepID=UPI001BE0D515|nr:hypothetical protein [Chryseobacterium sp. ZHDP1]QWA38842.1 hypothetical protein KKI44_01110 [Chryseobacterium sp. ZHDP1]